MTVARTDGVQYHRTQWFAMTADSPEEFASIIKEMRESAVEFGYDEVVAVDMQNATDLKAAREEVGK